MVGENLIARIDWNAYQGRYSSTFTPISARGKEVLCATLGTRNEVALYAVAVTGGPEVIDITIDLLETANGEDGQSDWRLLNGFVPPPPPP